MKKLFIAAIALTSVSYASAQATETKATTETTNIEVVAEVVDATDKRTAVKVDELPEAVKKSLSGDAYMGWTPTAAFWVEGKVSYYEVELSKGDDKSTVKLDKAGQIVK